MKHIPSLILTLGLASTTMLILSGCGGSGDHAGHDHGDHSHSDHSHADHSHEEAGSTADSATSAAEAGASAASLEVIANPTEAQIAAAKPYPLETCAVSGEELGSMGEPKVLLIGNQQIKLCCNSCMDDVKAAPQKILAGIATE